VIRRGCIGRGSKRFAPPARDRCPSTAPPDSRRRRPPGDRLGIAKVNVNTELREAYLAATQRRRPGLLAGARVMDLHRVQSDAVADVVTAKLATFEPAGDDAGRTS
jgi:hypothetical protein